ncbi:hypothetical protein [Tautonia rosea]|uniref:hypothetical protein n=1 Tax=Tautonia rosea TaxID=2728037 RepID=UPI0014728E37|nr:hypothetical protein [Tautonia rosea]
MPRSLLSEQHGGLHAGDPCSTMAGSRDRDKPSRDSLAQKETEPRNPGVVWMEERSDVRQPGNEGRLVEP